ncbi:ABC transporter permease, partial [Rhizobium brockwellii]|uniref:ABC transporter permease n=1 Tax=Rhizobium brockwellii TaxID=3019932 RepID=UPI003F9CE478
YSTRWFEELVTADAWRRSIVNSLIVGSGTTVLATVLGMTASLGLRNRNILFLGAAKTLLLLPMVVPAVVLGVGMQVLFVRVGIA